MQERIIEISKQEKLSHIGSNITMAQVLEEVYSVKKPQDIVILDAGHAHLAHLVAQEKFEDKQINLPLKDIHCNTEDGCEVATGSLGLGITIALGRAIADQSRDVYCVLSDGGCAEGSVWESLRIKSDRMVNNLKVYVNANGYSALGFVDVEDLTDRLQAFDPTIQVRRTSIDNKILQEYPQLDGLSGHYAKI